MPVPRSLVVAAGVLAALPSALAPLPAQNEILYYKFDAGGGDHVLNFVSAAGAAPRQGRIVSSSAAAAWTRGRFSAGLAGLARTPAAFNRVETGWAANVTGDFTCAFFLRVATPGPAPTDTDLVGVPTAGGFRMHTGSTVLIAEAVEQSNTSYATNADVWQLANVGWVHVAFVVDTNRSTATFYIDGQRDVSHAIGGGAAISGPDFWIGQHLSTQTGSVYDLDEVRVLTRAATPLEVQAWAQTSENADVGFGAGCGGLMMTQNGPPRPGNGSYAALVGSLPNGFGVLAIGASRLTLGAIPLPLDLGVVLLSLRGCLWHTSSELMFPFSLDGQGGGAFALPIPTSLQLLYRPLYLQALFTDLASEQTTNAVAVSIGT